MEKIFEIVDKTGRKIRLTKKQWSHIKLIMLGIYDEK